ncbi:matrix metallopeptidase 30 [Aplochiton taeniatus]
MELKGVAALLVAVIICFCEAVPTTIRSPDASLPVLQDGQSLAETYLSQFYSSAVTTPGTSRRVVTDPFERTLERMQEFFGLEVTGILDTNTLEVMAKPRCGVPDVARYAHFGGMPRWTKSVLTYRITLYTSDLRRSDVDATIAKAFQLYSDVIPLDFKQINSGTADIMILFKARNHGDFYPFDGPSGVLAHANSPGEGEGGDTHFDEDENWTLTQRGINLLLVAAHEFGHALGLDHSRDPSALMYPTYKYVNTYGYKLPNDDRRGVQALYGVRNTGGRPDPKPQPKPDPKPQPKPEPRPEPRPEPPTRCDRDLVFDAATSIQNELYFFKNGYFWKKSGYWNGIRQNTVQSVWPGISYVDAAYERTKRNVAYFFKGGHYWGISANTILSGYPKPLSNFGFPSSVIKIDAALHLPSKSKTLFFVNDKYWSFNERKGKMDRGYPRYIHRDFPGIGNRVDAAFENNGYLYFSNGARQTEYYYPSRRVIRVLLNYGWLNCY